MAGFKPLVGVLFDHQHREPDFSVESTDCLEYLLSDDRRQSRQRIIHQYQTRLMHKRTADLEHALLAT